MKVDGSGWLLGALQIPSPNCDARPVGEQVSLLVMHSISLPPASYVGPGVTSLFCNALDQDMHQYYREIKNLRVSAHAFIRRDGSLVQYVPFGLRAWHAGVSSWNGRERCNDFSIGVELEGTDDTAFSEQQYMTLNQLVAALMCCYPIVDIVGHSDIAPGRKTDPGHYFDWMRLASYCRRRDKSLIGNP